MKLTQLDLFSGIGGFHLGFEKAGYEIESYFSEIDKYAIDVYKNNFKNSKYVGSVTDIQGKDLPKIDLVTFGSPCQDFSLAGKRAGMQGGRSSLITEAIRLVSECRPRIFIWENVKGTFSSNSGEDFWAIIQAFANIGGYRLEWQLLNSSWFLPQNRERVYLVGYIGDGSGGQVFPISENNQKINKPISNPNSLTLTTRYKASTSQGSYVMERNKISQKIGDFRYDEGFRWRKDNNSPTLTLKSNEILVKSATKKGYEKATKGDSINYSFINSKKRRGRVGKSKALTLDTSGNQAVYTDKIRRLTPIECERLQGFPDNWTQEGVTGVISDSQRYKMCGNAVTVDVVKAVAEKCKFIFK